MKKWIGALWLVVMIGMLTIGGTVGWIFRGGQIVNEFVPAEVKGEVIEEFDHQTKQNVLVRNTSNIPVYIRVALVPVWKDGECLTSLKTEETYTLDLNLAGEWFGAADGFYYYSQPVPVGESTEILINSCKPSVLTDESYKGKQFQLDVIASLLQAEPSQVVATVWGVTVQKDGSISK